jgi:uncharacterized protein (TIGR03067 family)
MIKLVVLLVFAYVALTTIDLHHTEMKQLEGVWNVSRFEVNGMEQEKEESPTQVIISGDRLRGIGPLMRFTLDLSKRPKWIELIFNTGDQSLSIHGIYDITEDELRLCFPVVERGVPFENKRPEDFLTKGKFVALLNAKRVIKKE